jgi:hypothetical protein
MIALLSAVLAVWARSVPALLAALTGTFLAWLTGWAWWRVSETQMTLLADFDLYGDHGRPAAMPGPEGS